ncbi:MAG: efflux RND transporter permease subunit [Bacteroidia bacterium]|nr:efflux RND transporter permease subunit [Bacteroidia bacterium]
MRSIIAYFIKYPITGNVIMVLVFIFGTVSLLNMKSTFFPQERERFINVEIAYPGAAPSEIEEGVITKIEDNLRGVSGGRTYHLHFPGKRRKRYRRSALGL